MRPHARHRHLAKLICIALAAAFWWIMKSRMEPGFWQRAWDAYRPIRTVQTTELRSK